MAFTRAALAAVVVATGFIASCEANAFLQARTEDGYITAADVESSLSQLSGLASEAAKLRKIEHELRPMFAALPKNAEGKLDTSVVRYALHRYFVQQHGWYMAGLDPAGASWTASAPTSLMKDRAPSFIQSLFEQRLHGRGLALEDLAIFAAVMADLVHKEVFQEMFKVYSSLHLPTVGPVPKRWSVQAVKAYLIQILIGGNLTITGMEDFDFLEQELPSIYPDWEGTYMWAEDFEQTEKLLHQAERNPFVPQKDTFDRSVAFVQELGHHFGAFQNLECRALKSRLVEMEYQGSGRIRLSKFYEGGINGDWTLSESVAYLRNLGVVDETDPSRPSVVIPNYMTSRTNCLTASGFYSVCCLDECEGLLAHIERDLSTPRATPAQLVASVSGLHSDTVDAPRNLSAPLVGRLEAIAAHHGGEVPLHGRLFAQWMHHAYPRECPFPHVSGTTSPMSPDDWMAHHGTDNVEATLEEMQLHHSRLAAEHPEQEGEEEEVALPWTHVEELLAHDARGASSSRWGLSAWLRCVMGLTALVSFARPLVRGAKLAWSGEASAAPGEKAEGYFV